MMLVTVSACSNTKETSEKNQETEGEENVESNENEGASKENDTEEIAEELHFAFNAQPPSLDPLVTTVTATRDVARHIFETLVTFDYDYEVQPMLAESWNVSEDGLTYTFNLRHGVMFHNGVEMTADDVVASMDRWKDNSVYARTFFSNATFEKVDDYTVALQLTEPSVFVLDAMASMDQSPNIMPKEIIENATETGVEEFIGTGPYKFVEWKQDQYILLEKYDEYQPVDFVGSGLSGKKEVFVKKLYFEIVTDSSTRLAGLQAGQYDIAYEIDLDMLSTLEESETVQPYHTYPEPTGLIFNKFEGLMTDIKLRQAINVALDQEAIGLAANINEESYRLNSGYMQEEQLDWYSDAGSELYNQNNIEKAKKLIEESDYNGETIRFLATRDYQDMYNASVVIHEQLNNIGLNVELEVYDWSTIVSIRSDPSKWEMLVTGLPVTTSPIEGLVYTDSWVDGPEDDKINNLLEEIKSSADKEEAKQLWDELQEYSWEYLPFVKLHDSSSLMGAQSSIEGLTSPFGPGAILWNVKINNGE